MTTSLQTPYFYPWPVIRLADLYLGYAEACVEVNDLETAKTYLNKVRERAGIPDVETSWSGIAALTQDKMRDIVRQERMVELYLEIRISGTCAAGCWPKIISIPKRRD